MYAWEGIAPQHLELHKAHSPFVIVIMAKNGENNRLAENTLIYPLWQINQNWITFTF